MEFPVPDKAADEPEEGELPVDELKVLTGPCQQVPALQLLSNKPEPTKRFLKENFSKQWILIRNPDPDPGGQK